MPPSVPVPMDRIEAFCHKWGVVELALFGSVLRPDFRPDSDVDVLVRLRPDHGLSLFEWVDMIDELKAIFGRDIDLVEEASLTNPIRRARIASSKRVLYAA